MEVIFGVSRLSQVAMVVRPSVVAGFMNAFGLFLLMTQVKTFKPLGAWLPVTELKAALVVMGVRVATILGLPPSIAIPKSLAGILAATVVAKVFSLPVATMSDVAPLQGGWAAFPSLVVPSLEGIRSKSALTPITSAAIGIMAISVVETILAQQVLNNRKREAAGKGGGLYAVDEDEDPDRMIVGLGLGNLVSACFGGFGGCGLIPISILNFTGGGRGRLSALSSSLF
jgi:SulP family sulfate permease